MPRSIVLDIDSVKEKIPTEGEIAYPDLLQAVNDDATIESKKQALLNVLQGGEFNVTVKLAENGKSVPYVSRKGSA